MIENGKVIKADHKPMIMKLNLSINPTKPEKVEILDFKSAKGQAKFKVNTNETDIFTKCFSISDLVMKQISQWRQELDKVNKKSFSKIRIRPKHLKPSAANSLINKRNKLAKIDIKGETKEAKELDA